MPKKMFLVAIAAALILLAAHLSWAEPNDITISPGKEDLPSSSVDDSFKTLQTISGACGQTTKYDTDWVGTSLTDVLYVDVDTSEAGFTSTPIYLTSLGGDTGIWNTTGATSIHDPTATSFRVYVQYLSGTISPATANSWGWHINWCGFGPTSGTDPTPLGDISFSLTWVHSGSSRSEGPDIDMWVHDPNGYTLSSSRDGYSLGPTPNGGLIDHDDLGGWGDGDGNGPERAYWPTGQASSGTYTFGVRYYQGDGTAYYSLKVYWGSSIYDTYSGTLYSSGGSVTVGSIGYY